MIDTAQWYTSKRMWTLGITGLCIALRWAGVNVPYTSEELTAIIYPVVEAAGVALAAWWTLRANRRLTASSPSRATMRSRRTPNPSPPPG